MATDWSNLLHPDYKNIEDMLRDFYVHQNLSLGSIGLILSIDKRPIWSMLKKMSIPVRRRGRPTGNTVRCEKEMNLREPRTKGFDVNSRQKEKRECRNYSDCLCIAAIRDDYVLPCANCHGEPQMNSFLMSEYILDFENHHDANSRQFGPWHATDKPTKHGFDQIKLADLRKLIEKHNLGEMHVRARDFKFIRFTMG